MLVFTEPTNSGLCWFASDAEDRTCGLCLYRVTKRRPSPVCFQVSDVAGFEAGALQRFGDNPLLGNAVRHRQPARCAVLVDRAATDHGPNPVTVANRILEPLDDDDAASLAAHIAVRGCIERLAPAVGREHVRAGERDHGCGGEQDVRATGQARDHILPSATLGTPDGWRPATNCTPYPRRPQGPAARADS